MRIGNGWQSILCFIALVAAGVMAPLHSSRAYMLVHVECGWIQGGNVTVVHEDGSSTSFPATWECWQVWQYFPDDPWGSGGGGGGGNPNAAVCHSLLVNKPAGCPDPVGSPTAYDFGRGQYPGGTAIPRLIAAADDEAIALSARAKIQIALRNHTAAIATLTTSMEEANAELISRVRFACEVQAARGLPGAYGTERCADAYARLQQEAGFPGYIDRLLAWMELNEIPLLGDLATYQALIEWGSPGDSLKLKYDMVTEAKQCSMWWDDIEAHDCAA